jgi:hypothetical protein
MADRDMNEDQEPVPAPPDSPHAKTLKKVRAARQNGLAKGPHHLWNFFDVVELANKQVYIKCLAPDCPTSCGVERLWSVLGNVTRDNRTNLAVEKTKKIMAVAAQERLEREQEKESREPPVDYLIESVFGV